MKKYCKKDQFLILFTKLISFSDIEEQECLWIIEAPNQEEIQLSWTSTISDCPETSNHVYVYDGLPKFVSKNTDSQTLGVFCLGSHYLTQTTKVRLIFRKALGVLYRLLHCDDALDLFWRRPVASAGAENYGAFSYGPLAGWPLLITPQKKKVFAKVFVPTKTL